MVKKGENVRSGRHGNHHYPNESLLITTVTIIINISYSQQNSTDCRENR